MNGAGRILVRPSGTESLVRVMVEADSDALVTQTIDAIILRIKQDSDKNKKKQTINPW